jgi:four helix bundle protein
MNYQDWEASVPDTIKGDSLWKVKAYRLGLFMGDLAWRDVTKLMRDKRTAALSDQLYRALGSISTNVAEGYSRGTGRDRARFHEHALGSARESRDWYYRGRHILREEVTHHRLHLLTEIIRLLLTMIPQQRGRVLREEGMPYRTTAGADELNDLLSNVPLPSP